MNDDSVAGETKAQREKRIRKLRRARRKATEQALYVLTAACRGGDCAKIKAALLGVDTDVNVRFAVPGDAESVTMTPLIYTIMHSSTQSSQLSSIEMLVELGADIDTCDSRGFTAVMTAVAAGNASALEFLLSLGADIDVAVHIGVKQMRVTAFILACNNGHADCVEALVRYGCDTNVSTSDDPTTRETGLSLSLIHI